MNREELLKAIEDKKQFIETMEKELEIAKADVYSQVLVGLIQETIEFHTDILKNYENALAVITPEVAPVGRPSQGITKKVSITLPDYLWEWMDEMVSDEFGSRSAFVRRLVLDSYIELNRIGK